MFAFYKWTCNPSKYHYSKHKQNKLKKKISLEIITPTS